MPLPGQCQHGATWDGIKCICPDGYYGVHCEIAFCKNGGTWAGGLCQCTENFQGRQCQFAKDIIEIQDGKEPSKAVLHHTGAAVGTHQPRTLVEVTSEGPAWEWGHQRGTDQGHRGWGGDARVCCLWVSFCLAK